MSSPKGLKTQLAMQIMITRYMLAPKVLGLVLCAPKGMQEECHRVRIRPGFVSSAPSVNTAKGVSFQVLSVVSESKKMPIGIKKGIIEKSL
jgi:hypothetical protein